MSDKLIDPTDGENRAVRWFLACYGSGNGITVGAMKMHLTRCGFPHWPDWVGSSPALAHLTKGGAQQWLQHLFWLGERELGRGKKFIHRDGRKGLLISSHPDDGACLVFQHIERDDDEQAIYFEAERSDMTLLNN